MQFPAYIFAKGSEEKQASRVVYCTERETAYIFVETFIREGHSIHDIVAVPAASVMEVQTTFK
jgi:hypothetical protein